MAIRPIRVLGDPVLKTVCEPITTFDDATRRLVNDLLETVDDPMRAGLAANQIGIGLRAFSFHVDDRHGYVLNPELVEVAEETETDDEGCLSVPGLWFPTTRASYAVVRGVDVDNHPVTVEGHGQLARCLQHETDHLNGLLYLDRLDRETRKQAMRAIRDQAVSGTA